MKIIDTELVSCTTETNLSVEMEDGRIINVQEIVWDNDTLAIPNKSYEVLDSGDELKDADEHEKIIEFVTERSK